MKINSVNPASQLLHVEKSRKIKTVKDEQNNDKRDRVELSENAKKLARSQNALSPERAKEIQKRIEEGFYNRDEVIEEVAKRILRSKDFSALLHHRSIDRDL